MPLIGGSTPSANSVRSVLSPFLLGVLEFFPESDFVSPRRGRDVFCTQFASNAPRRRRAAQEGRIGTFPRCQSVSEGTQDSLVRRESGVRPSSGAPLPSDRSSHELVALEFTRHWSPAPSLCSAPSPCHPGLGRSRTPVFGLTDRRCSARHPGVSPLRTGVKELGSTTRPGHPISCRPCFLPSLRIAPFVCRSYFAVPSSFFAETFLTQFLFLTGGLPPQQRSLFRLLRSAPFDGFGTSTPVETSFSEGFMG